MRPVVSLHHIPVRVTCRKKMLCRKNTSSRCSTFSCLPSSLVSRYNMLRLTIDINISPAWAIDLWEPSMWRESCSYIGSIVLVQFVINTLLLWHQFIVPVTLHQSPVVHQVDEMTIADGLQSMGDEQQRDAQLSDCRHEPLFGLGVKGRCGFVHEQNGWLLGQWRGYLHTLRLQIWKIKQLLKKIIL